MSGVAVSSVISFFSGLFGYSMYFTTSAVMDDRASLSISFTRLKRLKLTDWYFSGSVIFRSIISQSYDLDGLDASDLTVPLERPSPLGAL